MDFAIILFWVGAIFSIFSISSLLINFHGEKIVRFIRRREKISWL
jgi:hypothetical protein